MNQEARIRFQVRAKIGRINRMLAIAAIQLLVNEIANLRFQNLIILLVSFGIAYFVVREESEIWEHKLVREALAKESRE